MSHIHLFEKKKTKKKRAKKELNASMKPTRIRDDGHVLSTCKVTAEFQDHVVDSAHAFMNALTDAEQGSLPPQIEVLWVGSDMSAEHERGQTTTVCMLRNRSSAAAGPFRNLEASANYAAEAIAVTLTEHSGKQNLHELCQQIFEEKYAANATWQPKFQAVVATALVRLGMRLDEMTPQHANGVLSWTSKDGTVIAKAALGQKLAEFVGGKKACGRLASAIRDIKLAMTSNPKSKFFIIGFDLGKEENKKANRTSTTTGIGADKGFDWDRDVYASFKSAPREGIRTRSKSPGTLDTTGSMPGGSAFSTEGVIH